MKLSSNSGHGLSGALERVAIEDVTPAVDAGRYAAKRVRGDVVTVEASIFADGHDQLAAVLLWKKEGAEAWTEASMEPLVNDRWRGTFPVEELGRYRYTVKVWVDRFGTWRRDFEKRVEAKQDLAVDLLIGAELVREAAAHAGGEDARRLQQWADLLAREGKPEPRVAAALDPDLQQAARRNLVPRDALTYERELPLVVDPPRARFSAWYEMFPRSCSSVPGKHGTFRDVERRLPEIARMGFDVLYLPPIHPIGRTHRKGRNNTLKVEQGDCGSPWAIGSAEGGHKAIHPELGTLEDFRHLLKAARQHGIEVALDVAFHTSPDHPYVKSHPEWFRKRPDGTIQYAENPPKKYQDIYPFDFDTESREELWNELKSVFEYWIEQGVTIFRVDNPHTKPFSFWEWCIGGLKAKHPEVFFLSEAFTRPRVMYRLAKLGFSMSYTYFPWRNTKWELTEYLTELTQTPVRDFFRPSQWTNTPDILTAFLQHGGRPAFAIRFVLAATLGANYGIYGPAFELCESRALKEGSEEYLDSEKYQLRAWDVESPASLRELMARVNRIRRDNPALHSDWGLRFHPTDNDLLLCYSKTSEDQSSTIVVVVNLDPHHTQAGWIHLPAGELGLEPSRSFQAHDLLSDARYLWQGQRHYVELNPGASPAHILRMRRHVRSEKDFDYFT